MTSHRFPLSVLPVDLFYHSARATAGQQRLSRIPYDAARFDYLIYLSFLANPLFLPYPASFPISRALRSGNLPRGYLTAAGRPQTIPHLRCSTISALLISRVITLRLLRSPIFPASLGPRASANNNTNTTTTVAATIIAALEANAVMAGDFAPPAIVTFT